MWWLLAALARAQTLDTGDSGDTGAPVDTGTEPVDTASPTDSGDTEPGDTGAQTSPGDTADSGAPILADAAPLASVLAGEPGGFRCSGTPASCAPWAVAAVAWRRRRSCWSR
jgi:hypothetical protein